MITYGDSSWSPAVASHKRRYLNNNTLTGTVPAALGRLTANYTLEYLCVTDYIVGRSRSNGPDSNADSVLHRMQP